MKDQNYTATLQVNATAQEVFRCINSVSEWWTEDLDSSAQKLHDEFTVRFGNIHVSTQKVVELIPDKIVGWLVTDSKLSFVEDKQEWKNSEIYFELSEHDNKTQVNFTHIGLDPDLECYHDCVKGWNYYLKESLFKLLTEGKGTPGL